MKLVIASVLVAAAAVVACANDYEGAVVPAADAGNDAAVVPDAMPVQDAGIAADADAVVDADVNPCDAGYALTDGGCDIANPFRDPSFQTGEGWTTTTGTEILVTAGGVDDLGVARISAAHSGVKQTISLPDSLLDVGLAIVATDRAIRPNGAPGLIPLGITSNGRALYQWPFLGYGGPGGTLIDTPKACIGEAMFGGPREIAFLEPDFGFSTVDVDHVGLVADPTCPKRGVIANGDFESGGTWEFTAKTQVAITDGGLRFDVTSLTPATATQRVSVPSVSMPHPALQFSMNGTGIAFVRLDTTVIAARTVSATSELKTVCMPDWARGVVVDLTIGSGPDDFAHDVDDVGNQFVIDDVKLVDSPTCAAITSIENGGFESSDPNIPGWRVHGGKGYTITRGTTDPHSGSGYLSLAHTSAACASDGADSVSVTQTVGVPAYTLGSNAARVTYWYRYTPGAVTTSYFSLDENPLVAAATWTKQTFCLDDDATGARRELQFILDGGDTGCTPGTLDIDDVVVDVDPSCSQ